LTSAQIMVSEVYRYKFYKHFEDTMLVSEIQQNDDLVVYELEDVPTSWPGPKTKTKSMLYFDDPPEDLADSERLLVPVYLKREQRGNRRYAAMDDSFSVPFFTVLNRDEQYDYEAIVENLVQKIQLLTTRNLYDDPLEAEEEPELEGPEELVNASEVKEIQDEEKDGFVDVSMRDAVSTTASEDAETALVAETGQRRVPPQTTNLFTIKISKRKESARLPAGWNAPDGDIELASRLQPSRNRTPSPLPQQPSALFSSLVSAGNSGHRSPASQASDDECFHDAIEPPEPNDDTMEVSSDEELGTAYSNATLNVFPPSTSTHYYDVSNNSPANIFSSPSRSPALSVNNGPLVRLGEAIVIEFNEDGYQTTFGGNHPDDFRGSFTSWPLLRDPELTRRRQLRAEKEKRGTHLEDCLDEFAKEEVLSAEDPWYCPRCKEHRRASKKFELWKCPDILVIHLKRFSNSRSFRDKIDAHIICPTEGLDLGGRVGVTDGKEQIYDLIAVDNHYGGLGGGHYTAYVRNWMDGKWYYCDGSSPPPLSPDPPQITRY
jgi:ubiquitin carboxyl-terminal hydrolase 4/11/15